MGHSKHIPCRTKLIARVRRKLPLRNAKSPALKSRARAIPVVLALIRFWVRENLQDQQIKRGL
jgi:hypothetical protein